MLEKVQTQRVDWLDVAKGIGIFFVIICHIFTISAPIVNLFNMPIFLFASGYFFKPDSRFGEYMRKKAFNFFVPYVAFFLTMVIPLETLFMADASWLEIGKRLVRDALSGRNIGVPATTFWFLPCLFTTQQIYNYISVKFSLRTVTWLMVLSIVIGHLFVYFFYDTVLIGRQQVVLSMLPVFHAGFVFRHKFEHYFNSKKALAIVLLLFAISTSISIYNIAHHYQYWQYMDMAQNHLGIPFLTFGAVIISILVLRYISKAIARNKGWFFKSVTYFGQASLIVMLIHQPIQYMLQRYLGMGAERIIPTVLLSVLIFYILNKFDWTRTYFLGVVPRKK